MSSGGRIFIVVLVVAFMTTGFYYLAVTGGDESEGSKSLVIEPERAEQDETPVSAPTIALEGAPVEAASPPAVAETTPVLASSSVAFRVAVPASNPVGVDLAELRQKLREQGPEVFRSGIAAWFPIYDASVFAEAGMTSRALGADPAGYFEERYGLVVERHETGLQMLLYTLPSKALVPSTSRSLDLVGIDEQTGDAWTSLELTFDEPTNRLIRGLAARNATRPCAILVEDTVVSVSGLDEASGTMRISGFIDEAQAGEIREAILGDSMLVVKANVLNIEPERPIKGAGDDTLVLTTTTTVPSKPEAPAPTSAPEVTRPIEPVASNTAMTRYTVKEGDTLTSISDAFYGNETSWILIAEANPAINPNRLSIGQVLMLPPKNTRPAPVKIGSGTHIVRSGESLSSISEAHYGEARHWELIYEANRAKIGSDPGDLKVDMVLVIPTR
ncbi:MAG: LysM peptidoglycan-binding domain-containing protein [Phycisphaerales bacterium]|nr:LysM peptidoglycan-binding domain-containing protein [Phycisphaerales bacterium]